MALLLIPMVLVALGLCGYLTACAGAERWLTLGEWWGEPKPDPLIEAHKAAMNAELDAYLAEPDGDGVKTLDGGRDASS